MQYRYQGALGGYLSCLGMSDEQKESLIINDNKITILVSPHNPKHHAPLCDWLTKRYKLTKTTN